MLNFLGNKKFLPILFIGGIAAAVLAFVFLTGKFPYLSLNGNHNQLSQIIAIETQALVKWQQAGSLKTTLAYGSWGRNVALLQRMLAQDTALYSKQLITGYYGGLTKQAVEKFQDEYGLAKTGAVDAATKNKLNEIFLTRMCPEPTVSYPEFMMRKVDPSSALPDDYIPPSLTDISDKVKTAGVICVRSEIIPFLEQMFTAAEGHGIELMVTSGYRLPEIQQYLYDFWQKVEGVKNFNDVAKPGFSEHQLGTAVDLTDGSIGFAGVSPEFAQSDGGKWLEQNAWEYGFIMSYPEAKENETGYAYEPWHWRFVGLDIAKQLRESGEVFNKLATTITKVIRINQ